MKIVCDGDWMADSISEVLVEAFESDTIGTQMGTKRILDLKGNQQGEDNYLWTNGSRITSV